MKAIMIPAILSRLVPRSLAGRTVLTLVVGLTASHLLSMLVYSCEHLDRAQPVDQHMIVDRVAAIVGDVGAVPSRWRQPVIDAADGPFLHVSVTKELDPRRTASATDPMLMAMLGQRLMPAGATDGANRGILAGLTPPHPSGDGPDVVPWLRQVLVGVLHGSDRGPTFWAAIPAPDGAWINFEAPISDPHASQAGHAAVSALVMGAAILLLSCWVVRHLTRPLSQVAAAAERLGRDVAALPLSESGPIEVRMVAHAFNSMQERLRRFVEDRTRMLAAISHDLRTPITLLRLRTEFIAESEERVRMRATLDEMETMIAATLSFARDDADREPRQTVYLVGLLSSICYDMADAGLPVTFEPDIDHRLPIDCRLSALKRALTNLIDNAVRYGHAARVDLTVTAATVAITIDDDGPGIPVDEWENVFKPFYRLDPSGSADTAGVGLGLSVARTVVHGHGGDIRFENRADGGLRVRVTLPLAVHLRT